MNKGALIAFEGIDGCGKTTQVEILKHALLMSGCEVELMKFPCRSTPIGRIIDQYLRKEIELEDGVAHLLFVANRREWKAAIEAKIDRGTVVIVDRYVASGAAYSIAKGLNPTWCTSMEEDMPRCNLIIYLDIEANVAFERINSRGLERFEDPTFLKRVKNVYDNKLYAAEWCGIDGTLNREDIAAKIENVAKRVIFAGRPDLSGSIA